MKFIHTIGDWKEMIKATGLVFGDIGTSPIYTMSVIFLLIPATPDNVFGIISLIFWTLIIVVTIEHVILAMRHEHHGEGGTLILKKILDDLISKGKTKSIFAILAFAGVALLFGDGVITPSISILSAVEGIRFLPHFQTINHNMLVGFAMLVAVGLFIFQSKGTDRVAGTFGPIMLVWFGALAGFGIYSIIQTPSVIYALSPHYAVLFFKNNSFAGVILLSQVILCATGAEALYADIGHIGKKPIISAWNWIFVAVVLNYMGQGAYLIRHGNSVNYLFAMVQNAAPVLYLPFLILTIVATVIASQALISGAYSIVYQAINMGILPRLRIDFTSNKLKSQIYIPLVNWLLLALVIFMMAFFQKSENLAVAYGFAVTATMCITGLFMMEIFRLQKKAVLFAAALFVSIIDFIFLFATFSKLPYGGYWSLVIASFPFMLILLWTRGQRLMFSKMQPMELEKFLPLYKKLYSTKRYISGTALYFISSPKIVSPYIVHTITQSNIIYKKNIFISINRSDDPYDITASISKPLASGLYVLKIVAGYKEDIDIGKILDSTKLEPKVIFYGVEDIHTTHFLWRIFAGIRRLAPSFVKFYKVPSEKLHGIMTRIEM